MRVFINYKAPSRTRV